jgi:thymidylate synthase
MTTPTWEDCTAYSRGDRERIPTTFEIKSGKLQIVITNCHIYHKDVWVMHCFRLGIDTRPLPAAITREQAQLHAKKQVENLLAELQQDLDAIP